MAHAAQLRPEGYIFTPEFHADLNPFLNQVPTDAELSWVRKFDDSLQRLIGTDANLRQQLTFFYFFRRAVEAGVFVALATLPETLRPKAYSEFTRQQAIELLDLLSRTGLAASPDPGLYDLHPWLRNVIYRYVAQEYPEPKSFASAVEAFTHAMSDLSVLLDRPLGYILLTPIIGCLLNGFALSLRFGYWQDLIGVMRCIRSIWRVRGMRLEWEALVQYVDEHILIR